MPMYVPHYSDKFEKLENKIKELENARDRIQCLVITEESNGNEVAFDVLNWLERADKITKVAKRLLEDPRRAKAEGSICSFPKLSIRRQRRLTSSITDEEYWIIRFVSNLMDEMEFKWIGVGSTSSIKEGTVKLESRECVKKNIVEFLKDPQVTMVGVYGVYGVGKTTLIKDVAKQFKDDKLFDVVLNPNRSQLTGIITGLEIACQLGLFFEEEWTVNRANKLCERINRDKSILIIIDDIREKFDLHEMGIPYGDDHKGCKVLLTSTNQEILHEMETQKDFRLNFLNEEETRTLFQVMAGNIATQVAEKCLGWPLLVARVAEELKNKDIQDWEGALKEKFDNIKYIEYTYSYFGCSYDQMDHREAQLIFLLCGVIGKNIVTDDFFKYAVGLFKYSRNEFDRIITRLKAYCLLLEDDTNAQIKMHDIVREFAISTASKDNSFFIVKRNDELKIENTFERCSYMILDCPCIQKFPERLDCHNLQLLYLDSSNNPSLKIPDSFFEGMRNLKVLSLTGINMSPLPASIWLLTELKTLCLDQCALGE